MEINFCKYSESIDFIDENELAYKMIHILKKKKNMKTTFKIAIIILTFISQLNFSQSLLIKGFFKNANNESIQVNYLLISHEVIVASGIDKKIKIELELNNDYILIVSKNGFVTKSVTFSTYTNDNEYFSFDFDMFLKEDVECKTNITNVSTKVFYDTKLRAFNYVINKKQQSQH